MQPKRNLGESAPKPPYLQQTPAPGAPGPTRSQHAPPTFYGGYPTRVPPPTSSGMPPQGRFGYPPARQPPFLGSTASDERDPRYDRTAPQPPPMTSGYQRPPPPPSSYGFPQPGYPGGPPPPPRGDARSGGQPGNGHPGSPSYGPPYGGPPTYIPPQRSQSWGTTANAGDRYPEGFHAPYTSAQRNAGEKTEPKEHDASSGQFRVVGEATKKQPYAPYQQPRVDADAMAYKAVEGRDGATSPSQIESNRRDDVSNMGCTCKKSKCLKLYCVCFGASVMCGSNCRCMVCHNTPLHEQSRKDAIRSILARNPNAFDTKFKKTADQRVLLAQARPLAHKLGCKCRKSFCTKKYCECYNAGVKCSGSCRCINCKNMPPGGFGGSSGKDGHTVIVPRSFADGVMRVKKGQKKHPPNSEHKMMHAAQHLAFLKHGSPARERRDIQETRQNSTASMPSLAASSSGASSSSPDAEATSKPIEPVTSSGGVNTLLMAAYAMTELGEAEPLEPSKSTPATPEKRKAKTFRSPKRKSGNAVAVPNEMIEDQFADADDAEHAKDEIMESAMLENGPTLMTPGDLRRVKRTRVGTVERRPPTSNLPVPFDATPRTEKPTSDSEDSEQNESGEEQDQPSPDNGREKQKEKLVLSTPTANKTAKTIGDLTPVTARCIDFRHMGVADKDTSDEKKDDSELTTQ